MRPVPKPRMFFNSVSRLAIAIASVCALLALSAGCNSTPEEKVPSIIPWQEEASLTGAAAVQLTAGVEDAAGETDPAGVELLTVGFAADGYYIMVSFKSPPEAVEDWWQGSIYVIDESTGTVYEDIPVAPNIGLLLAKPQQEGQIGYAMLNNYGAGIRYGSVVSVVLGNFKREHIKVQ